MTPIADSIAQGNRTVSVAAAVDFNSVRDPAQTAVVTIEDNGRQGGVGSTVVQAVSDAGLAVPVRVHGIAQEFLPHAKRDVLLERLGLTAPAVADDALRALSGAGNNEG